MDHDAAYKEFFVFIRMVRNFLRAFAPDAAMRFNFKVYELLPTSFLSDAGLRREGDLAWRFGLLDDPRGAAIVPIEFQSTPDPEMVQRMELYKALCLSAAARHPWGSDPARLRVLPVVVYNGAKPWRTAGDAPPAWTTDAVAGPKASYRLVDLSALDGYDLEAADVAGALVQLERAKTADAFRAVAVRLAGMLAEPEDAALRRAFTSWIANLMKHRNLRTEGLDITQLLAGGKPMIAETMDRWTQEWLRQGRNEGRQQGLQEGRDEGLQRGLRQGRNEGLEQQKALVRQQAERKFGPEVAAVLARLLGPASDLEPVQDAALAIVDCETGAEFLGRVR